MDNVRIRLTCVLITLAVVVLPVLASANLTPVTVGIPAIVQSGSTSAFNQDTANATDFEAININFPVSIDGLSLGPTALSGSVTSPIVNATGSATANVLPFGPVDMAFPDVNQVVDQTQDVTHTDFSQTNEVACFTYPFCVAGPVALPGFGFGF